MRKIAFVVACTIWLLLSFTLLSEAVLPGLSGKVTSQTAPSSCQLIDISESPQVYIAQAAPANQQKPQASPSTQPAPQPPSQPQANQSQPQTVSSPSPPPPAPPPPARRGEISFNFDDADIYEVAQTVFGDIVKANYIIDPKVKGRVTFMGLDPSNNLRLFLQILATEGNLQVLSSPHILVSDNKEAKIQVGRQVPIATSETLTTTAPAQTTTTIKYKDIGIILKVKPQINEGKEAEQAG